MQDSRWAAWLSWKRKSTTEGTSLLGEITATLKWFLDDGEETDEEFIC